MPQARSRASCTCFKNVQNVPRAPRPRYISKDPRGNFFLYSPSSAPKVSEFVESGAIFQHKAVLSYLTFTYSCHVLPSCLQVAFKMAQDRNLGPTWPHLASSWLPRGPQEASKRPPRGPKKPHIHYKKRAFYVGGVRFLYHTKLRPSSLQMPLRWQLDPNVAQLGPILDPLGTPKPCKIQWFLYVFTTSSLCVLRRPR